MNHSVTFKSFIIFLVFAGGFTAINFFLFNFPHGSSINIIPKRDNDNIKIDLSRNYFQSREKLESGGFLVNTSKCRIPAVDFWHSQLRGLIKPPQLFNCTARLLMLTYVEIETVVINKTLLSSMGYALEDIDCCCQTIERVEQFRKPYNKYADSLFRISEECTPMERVTKPESGFIKVTCQLQRESGHKRSINYTNFHMIAMFPDDKELRISKKLKWWQDCLSDQRTSDPVCSQFQQQGRPPNVLIFGWDSTSRANFHRFMPKTKFMLQNVLGAVEMVGYNKVGSNTFANFVPLTTSFSIQELQKLCVFNMSLSLDDCPFIWKKFNEHNYLTGHVEDAPGISIFNYLKAGFGKPPTDIYTRPWMLAAYEEYRKKPYYLTDCIGYQRPEEIILNYIADLAELSEARKIPYILSTWLTDLTHENFNNLQAADNLMSATLEKMHRKGLLQNTVVILLSDHGYIFLNIRTTATGWLEENLPTLWIALPPSLVSQRKSWLTTLQRNSHALVTPFDIYEALQDILILSSPKTRNPVISTASQDNLRGISPFKKIPKRSCEEAGIPAGYCACNPPIACNLNIAVIKTAANVALKSVNLKRNWTSGCVRFKGATVTACGIVGTNRDAEAKVFKKLDEESISYPGKMGVIIAFKTNPGNFLIEARVNHEGKADGYGDFPEVSKVTRIDKHNTSLACLQVPKDGVTELFCYCYPNRYRQIMSKFA